MRSTRSIVARRRGDYRRRSEHNGRKSCQAASSARNLRQGRSGKLKSSRPNRHRNYAQGNELLDGHTTKVIRGYPVKLLDLIWLI